MIYFAFVYTRLCYGSEIYGNTYQTHVGISIIWSSSTYPCYWTV